jgi:uroporphyrinogen decarboxylase
MTNRERMIVALGNGKPDRLPATTHHLQPYYLSTYENGKSENAFFKAHGLDPISWINPVKPDTAKGDYLVSMHNPFRQIIVNDRWNMKREEISGQHYPTLRYTIQTPEGTLTMVEQIGEHSSWIIEHLIKKPEDIELLAKYAPAALCDVAHTLSCSKNAGTESLVRSSIPSFEIFGQPGCWQDAACLVGIQNLIMATFDDPGWVKELLTILMERKLVFMESSEGAAVDVFELGGGDASTTVISPDIFGTFVAPFDKPIIEAAHRAGQRIVYHTCGGMMPILEKIADMGPDAMETFAPPGMGGDVDLSEAFQRIGERVCFIGGFDQGTFFWRTSPEETKNEVYRCFEACGRDGGFILSPSDHFFDAKPELITAFAEAAAECRY